MRRAYETIVSSTAFIDKRQIITARLGHLNVNKNHVSVKRVKPQAQIPYFPKLPASHLPAASGGVTPRSSNRRGQPMDLL